MWNITAWNQRGKLKNLKIEDAEDDNFLGVNQVCRQKHAERYIILEVKGLKEE